MKTRWLATLLTFVALIIGWELLVRAGYWSKVLIPEPVEVGKYLVGAIHDKTLLTATAVTMKRLLLGYFVSVIVGLPLGLITARFRFAQDTLGVIALGLQTLPSVCWAPLALLWFGQTETAMFFIVVMGSLWSVMLATDAGVRSVPPIYARAARTMGSRDWHTWLHVILPASLPFVVSGMKQGWAFAWRSLMAAEIYITIINGVGLGNLLHYGREFNAMDQVLGIIIVIVLIGLLTDKILFAPFERFMHRRWGLAK